MKNIIKSLNAMNQCISDIWMEADGVQSIFSSSADLDEVETHENEAVGVLEELKERFSEVRPVLIGKDADIAERIQIYMEELNTSISNFSFDGGAGAHNAKVDCDALALLIEEATARLDPPLTV